MDLSQINKMLEKKSLNPELRRELELRKEILINNTEIKK